MDERVRIANFALGERYFECLYSGRLSENGIDARQRAKRADHEARTDQQHGREAHLHDHEGVSCAMAFAALAERAAALAKSGTQTTARIFEDWDCAKEQASD